MRTTTIPTILLLLGVTMAPAPAFGQETFTYVGVAACGKCHKTEKIGNQLAIWEGTKHSKAFESLSTPVADSIALAKGLTTKAADSKECRECHTTGGPDSGVDAKEGVGCEACHNAGSGYRVLKIMKDKPTAVEKGLRTFADAAAIEAQCRTCHNERSPTAKEFDFKERWEKIKHLRPVE